MPEFKSNKGLFWQQLGYFQFPLMEWSFQFLVDEVIVKAYGRSIDLGVSIIDGIDACPIDGAKTHRAWLATGVDGAAFEIAGDKVLASDPNC